MSTPLPELVPLDRLAAWSEHDAYFEERGVAAWLGGEIPCFSTNNYAFAGQHAWLLVAHVEALEAEGALGVDEPIWILEVGGGLGRFARNLLRALDGGTGDAGRRIGRRVRYVFSDSSARTVREAAGGPELAALVGEGRVLPAIYDCRRPAELRLLDGGACEARFAAMICSYVCCVLPNRHLRRRGGGWEELRVERSAREPVPSWVGVEPGEPFAEAPLHARLVREILDGTEGRALAYPHRFLDFLQGARPLLGDGGIAVINDYGPAGREQLPSHDDWRPLRLAATLNHPVPFCVFDAFADATEWDLMRTRGPLDAIHTAVLRRDRPLAPAVVERFDQRFVVSHASQELLDIVAAGRLFRDERDFHRAARFFARAIDLDPFHGELYLLAGLACVDAKLADFALQYLRAGRALDAWGSEDYDFHLGEAHACASDLDAALEAYRRSLRRLPRSATHHNIGALLQARGDVTGAAASFREALALDAHNIEARQRLSSLEAS